MSPQSMEADSILTMVDRSIKRIDGCDSMPCTPEAHYALADGVKTLLVIAQSGLVERKNDRAEHNVLMWKATGLAVSIISAIAGVAKFIVP